MDLIAVLFLGAFVGFMGGVFNVVVMRGRLQDLQITMLLTGGIFGGGVTAVAMLPGATVIPQTILFLALAGYFSADVFAAIAAGKKS